MIGVFKADHMDYTIWAVIGMQTMWTLMVEPKLHCTLLGMELDIGWFAHMEKLLHKSWLSDFKNPPHSLEQDNV